MLTLVLEEQFSDRTHLDKKKTAEEDTFTFHKIENRRNISQNWEVEVEETFTIHKIENRRNISQNWEGPPEGLEGWAQSAEYELRATPEITFQSSS